VTLIRDSGRVGKSLGKELLREPLLVKLWILKNVKDLWSLRDGALRLCLLVVHMSKLKLNVIKIVVLSKFELKT
jgi:hypothetical protein